jgi:hypothetical protein
VCLSPISLLSSQYITVFQDAFFNRFHYQNYVNISCSHHHNLFCEDQFKYWRWLSSVMLRRVVWKSVNFYQTTRRNIREDSHLHTRSEKLISQPVNSSELCDSSPQKTVAVRSGVGIVTSCFLYTELCTKWCRYPHFLLLVHGTVHEVVSVSSPPASCTRNCARSGVGILTSCFLYTELCTKWCRYPHFLLLVHGTVYEVNTAFYVSMW